MGSVDMCILRNVLKVKFTKCRTCARGKPREEEQLSGLWTGFPIIVELEPYMLKAYLGNKLYMEIDPLSPRMCAIGIFEIVSINLATFSLHGVAFSFLN